MKIIKKAKIKPAKPSAGYVPDILICFSHLRWDFVFQRPQHILSRLAKQMQVFYIEEPVEDNTRPAHYVTVQRGPSVTVIVPHLPGSLNNSAGIKAQENLFADFMTAHTQAIIAFWYYTPMALLFSRNFMPEVTIYDCMDELSAFKFAPKELKSLEQELLEKSDVVFTGGHSLYEAKKTRHSNIHAFPSSIDKQHFTKARLTEFTIGRKKNSRFTLGFYGVIDERFDIELVGGIADQRPEWDIILIGPVVKIDPATLPANNNIKYLGPKSYEELPKLISDWDIALIPFLLNESTRFISPTKTPEYLAAGLPVISTAIRDVVHPYGQHQLVMIGQDASEFIALAEQVCSGTDKKEWLQRVDFFLSDNSWDHTCERMLKLISQAVKTDNKTNSLKIAGAYV
jgi:glycosyltransferase involved in cell wall biosynthesis